MIRRSIALDASPPKRARARVLRDATFEAWYAQYHRSLVGYCSRLLCDEAAGEDVAQETLFRAWVRRDQFPSEANISPWLWRVARNLCVDMMRARSRVVPSDSLPECPADGADPGSPIEVEQERQAVREALGVLSERHRELLYLREVQGLGYDELASRLGVSQEGARAVLFRARRSLRDALAAGGALGAFLPFGRVWAAFRRATSGLAGRASARPAFGLELAAGVLVFVTAVGSGHGPGAGVDPGLGESVQAASSEALIPVDGVASEIATGVAHLSNATTPTVDGAAARPPIRPVWRTNVTLGGDRNDPDSGVQLDISVISGSDEREKLFRRLPDGEVNVLPNPEASPPG